MLEAEVLQSHRDVLRVGRVTVGSAKVPWQTAGSSDGEILERYLCAVGQAILREPLFAGSERDARCAACWYCKAVSINYVFADVLRLLGERIGASGLTIETLDAKKRHLVEYKVDIVLDMVSGPQLRASLVWNGKGNLIARKSRSAKQSTKGTVSLLETCFPLPPSQGFVPSYRVAFRVSKPRMSLKKASSEEIRFSASSALADSCAVQECPREFVDSDMGQDVAHVSATDLGLGSSCSSSGSNSRRRCGNKSGSSDSGSSSPTRPACVHEAMAIEDVSAQAHCSAADQLQREELSARDVRAEEETRENVASEIQDSAITGLRREGVAGGSDEIGRTVGKPVRRKMSKRRSRGEKSRVVHADCSEDILRANVSSDTCSESASNESSGSTSSTSSSTSDSDVGSVGLLGLHDSSPLQPNVEACSVDRTKQALADGSAKNTAVDPEATLAKLQEASASSVLAAALVCHDDNFHHVSVCDSKSHNKESDRGGNDSTTCDPVGADDLDTTPKLGSLSSSNLVCITGEDKQSTVGAEATRASVASCPTRSHTTSSSSSSVSSQSALAIETLLQGESPSSASMSLSPTAIRDSLAQCTFDAEPVCSSRGVDVQLNVSRDPCHLVGEGVPEDKGSAPRHESGESLERPASRICRAFPNIGGAVSESTAGIGSAQRTNPPVRESFPEFFVMESSTRQARSCSGGRVSSGDCAPMANLGLAERNLCDGSASENPQCSQERVPEPCLAFAASQCDGAMQQPAVGSQPFGQQPQELIISDSSELNNSHCSHEEVLARHARQAGLLEDRITDLEAELRLAESELQGEVEARGLQSQEHRRLLSDEQARLSEELAEVEDQVHSQQRSLRRCAEEARRRDAAAHAEKEELLSRLAEVEEHASLSRHGSTSLEVAEYQHQLGVEQAEAAAAQLQCDSLVSRMEEQSREHEELHRLLGDLSRQAALVLEERDDLIKRVAKIETSEVDEANGFRQVRFLQQQQQQHRHHLQQLAPTCAQRLDLLSASPSASLSAIRKQYTHRLTSRLRDQQLRADTMADLPSPRPLAPPSSSPSRPGRLARSSSPAATCRQREDRPGEGGRRARQQSPGVVASRALTREAPNVKAGSPVVQTTRTLRSPTWKASCKTVSRAVGAPPVVSTSTKESKNLVRSVISPVSAACSSAAIDESPWQWPTKDDEIETHRLATSRSPNDRLPPSDSSARSSDGCVHRNTPERCSDRERRQQLLGVANHLRGAPLFWLGDGADAQHAVEEPLTVDGAEDCSSPAVAVAEPGLPHVTSPADAGACRSSRGAACDARAEEPSPTQSPVEALFSPDPARERAAAALRATLRCGRFCDSSRRELPASSAAAALQAALALQIDFGAAASAEESSKERHRSVRFAE